MERESLFGRPVAAPAIDHLRQIMAPCVLRDGAHCREGFRSLCLLVCVCLSLLLEGFKGVKTLARPGREPWGKAPVPIGHWVTDWTAAHHTTSWSVIITLYLFTRGQVGKRCGCLGVITMDSCAVPSL